SPKCSSVSTGKKPSVGPLHCCDPERHGCGRHAYPQPMWWRCLECADELDTARALTARHAAIDAAEYRTVHMAYYERLCGSTIAKMNGHPAASVRLRNPADGPLA